MNILKDIEKELARVKAEKEKASGEDLAFLKGYELACVEIKCLIESRKEGIDKSNKV